MQNRIEHWTILFVVYANWRISSYMSKMSTFKIIALYSSVFWYCYYTPNLYVCICESKWVNVMKNTVGWFTAKMATRKWVRGR